MLQKLLGVLFFILFALQPARAEVVDTTPPSAPGIPAAAVTVTNATSLTWEWSAATDPESQISDYQIDIGLVPSGNELVSRLATGGVTHFTLTDLHDGETYYAQVRAVNSGGLMSLWAANIEGVVSDQRPPAFTTDLTLVNRGAQMATLRWESDESVRATVRLWVNGTSTVTATVLETYQPAGSVTLNNLCSATTYRAVVEIGDQATNQTLGHEIQFETPPGEPCPQANQATANQVTLADAGQSTPTPSVSVSAGAGIELLLAASAASLPSPASPIFPSPSISSVIAGQTTAGQLPWVIGLSIAVVIFLVLPAIRKRRR